MKSVAKQKIGSVHVGFLLLGAFLLAASGYSYFGLSYGAVSPYRIYEVFQIQDRLLLRIGMIAGIFLLLTTNRFTLYGTGAVGKSFALLGFLPWYQRTYPPGYFKQVEMMLLNTQGTQSQGGGSSIHVLLIGTGKVQLNIGRHFSLESAKKAAMAAANTLNIPFIPQLKSTNDRWKDARADL